MTMKKWKPFGKKGPAVPVFSGTGTARDMETLKATATPVWLELEALKAVMDADYPRAVDLLRSMSAKDRAVLVFWLRELTGMADDVDISDKRWSVES